jgi:hypothetical protein
MGGLIKLAVTDLKGTAWRFNDNINITSTIPTFSSKINIKFLSYSNQGAIEYYNGIAQREWSIAGTCLCYVPSVMGGSLNAYTENPLGWVDEKYKYIFIFSGSTDTYDDTQNTAFISWLEANATQVPPITGLPLYAAGGITATIKNGTSVTPTGSYATSTYYDTSFGVKVSYTADGDVIITMKGGTSTAYEKIYFYKGTLPYGVTLTNYVPGSNATMDTGAIYSCVLSGITSVYNLALAMNSRNSTNDYVRVDISLS